MEKHLFVLRPSKVRKLVRTNQFQVKSTKMGTGRKFVILQYVSNFFTLCGDLSKSPVFTKWMPACFCCNHCIKMSKREFLSKQKLSIKLVFIIHFRIAGEVQHHHDVICVNCICCPKLCKCWSHALTTEFEATTGTACDFSPFQQTAD